MPQNPFGSRVEWVTIATKKQPLYRGIHAVPNAADTDDGWMVTKFKYDVAGDYLQEENQITSWANRTHAGWSF